MVDPEWERSGGSKFGRKNNPRRSKERSFFSFSFFFPLLAVINRCHVKDGLRRGKVKCAEFFCNTNLISKIKETLLSQLTLLLSGVSGDVCSDRKSVV